jgi:hypothetical protein
MGPRSQLVSAQPCIRVLGDACAHGAIWGQAYTSWERVQFQQSELSLAVRKTTLVALRRKDDSTFQACKTSFALGPCDWFGCRAKSPAEVLKFFYDPRGYSFLFPHNSMGPDLVGFLQDEETGELITLLPQDKVTPDLTRSTWLEAVNSTHPNLFYTMIVRLFFFCAARIFHTCL